MKYFIPAFIFAFISMTLVSIVSILAASWPWTIFLTFPTVVGLFFWSAEF